MRVGLCCRLVCVLYFISGCVTEKTGGQIFLYPGFNARKDGLAFQSDLYHNVTRRTGFDAVMIVRCSAGLRVADHYGAFYHKRPNEMDLPTIDADKTVGAEAHAHMFHVLLRRVC